MTGESFQQDGIVTVNGWQYAAFRDAVEGHPLTGREGLRQ
jgi:hypothetical protein